MSVERRVGFASELTQVEAELVAKMDINLDEWFCTRDQWQKHELAKAERFLAAEAEFLRAPDTNRFNWDDELPLLAFTDTEPLFAVIDEIKCLANDAGVDNDIIENIVSVFEYLKEHSLEQSLSDDVQRDCEIIERHLRSSAEQTRQTLRVQKFYVSRKQKIVNVFVPCLMIGVAAYHLARARAYRPHRRSARNSVVAHDSGGGDDDGESDPPAKRDNPTTVIPPKNQLNQNSPQFVVVSPRLLLHCLTGREGAV